LQHEAGLLAPTVGQGPPNRRGEKPGERIGNRRPVRQIAFPACARNPGQKWQRNKNGPIAGAKFQEVTVWVGDVRKGNASSRSAGRIGTSGNDA
jgi:hypothetical protein